jgi:hypothetical protein
MVSELYSPDQRNFFFFFHFVCGFPPKLILKNLSFALFFWVSVDVIEESLTLHTLTKQP